MRHMTVYKIVSDDNGDGLCLCLCYCCVSCRVMFMPCGFLCCCFDVVLLFVLVFFLDVLVNQA